MLCIRPRHLMLQSNHSARLSPLRLLRCPRLKGRFVSLWINYCMYLWHTGCAKNFHLPVCEWKNSVRKKGRRPAAATLHVVYSCRHCNITACQAYKMITLFPCKGVHTLARPAICHGSMRHLLCLKLIEHLWVLLFCVLLMRAAPSKKNNNSVNCTFLPSHNSIKK